MKKKRPQQQVTPPTKKSNILSVKGSAFPVEPPQAQPATVSIEKPELDAESAPEPVAQTPVDNPAHAKEAKEASAPVEDALASSKESTPEPVPNPIASCPAEGAIFQAIGIIQGDVTSDGDKTFVTIGEKSYRLYYAKNHRMAYEALKEEINSTGITQRKLIVYPNITHYPGGKQPYRLGFQLAGVVSLGASVKGLLSILEDLEFRISGLWQFVPICQLPCILVFKNSSQQRLKYIKSVSLDKQINFLKPSSIPVVWPDAPVPPFRFDPELNKEAQGKPLFVQIKARFNSSNDTFEFVSLLGVPSFSPPNYLKVDKKDKDKVKEAQTKRAASYARKRSSVGTVGDSSQALKVEDLSG
jgi:hypothetical protein